MKYLLLILPLAACAPHAETCVTFPLPPECTQEGGGGLSLLARGDVTPRPEPPASDPKPEPPAPDPKPHHHDDDRDDHDDDRDDERKDDRKRGHDDD